MFIEIGGVITVEQFETLLQHLEFSSWQPYINPIDLEIGCTPCEECGNPREGYGFSRDSIHYGDQYVCFTACRTCDNVYEF